ncbi:MAG: CRISPR-associated protein Cas4 [Planctomycetota bacterium]|nr:MAG: CRISPR-associated protein Cas4 [Planctomycetota bacterium]REK28442.1 MAG: CRISPR-associated protein Cas4 [Planctomycetota bacterium]REK29140.1 MAG: CRISPR-associated protein Cas4 [Planctomycetota bacterium]
MPHTESDLLPLSALQHLLFCERQCALIHVEQVWAENRFTAEGRILHNKAHDGKPETRDGVRITRGLPLHSFELGLSGQADVVLWEPPSTAAEGGTMVQRLRAATADELQRWTITPVEYKRGKPKSNDCDRVQLCAQAMCLEEMLGVSVRRGQLFYGQKRRRFDVEFDEPLRETTRQAAARVHELMRAGVTPPAVREKKCDTCSLLEICMPDVLGPRKSAKRFFDRQLEAVLQEP